MMCSRLTLLLCLLALSACRIVIVAGDGGKVVSRTGMHDCGPGQTCVVDVPDGDRFSDSFAAIPLPGFRFSGWEPGQRRLCEGSTSACVLEGIPGSLTSRDTSLNLVARFERDTALAVIPDRQFYTTVAGRPVSVPLQLSGNGGRATDLTLEGDQGGLSYTFGVDSLTLSPGEVDRVQVLELSIVASEGQQSASAALQLTVYPTTASGEGVTLVGSRDGPGIHLVVLAEGYRRQERDRLRMDAFNFYDELLNDPGIADHMSIWNLHVLEAVSGESGADPQFGMDQRDTAFGAGYNCSGVARLICIDESLANASLLQEFPHHHQAVVMVNSNEYGGSGGTIAVFNRTSPRIAVHELGHSFAGLADEYVQESIAAQFGADYSEGDFANVSQREAPDAVPWSAWIDDHSAYPRVPGEAGVGVFEGAYYHRRGFYRPMDSSLMRAIEEPFGPVNAEQWIMSIYARQSPVLAIQPEDQRVSLAPDQAGRFGVELLYDTGVQSVRWFLDGRELEGLRDRQRIDWSGDPGSYTLTVEVADRSGAIRRRQGQQATFSRSWTITAS